MCNSCNDPFHDLYDDLDEVFSPEAQAKAAARRAKSAPLRATHETRAAAAGHRYTEKCDACRGTGRWTSRSGYSSGACFKCKGKGQLTFKTSPEAREKARLAAERLREQKGESLRASAEQWKVDNAADWAWIAAKRETFDFADSMGTALHQFGSLTDKQHAAVVRLREKDEARKVEAQQRAANAPVVNLVALETAFSTAMDNGIKKPKLRLATFKFSLAPAHGVNAGAIYVVRAGDDQYLGKIKDGKFMRVRECDQAEETSVIEVLADPKAAAIAYGKRTGNCCICGRELTNAESIDLGIGPICAEKMGW